ncbi:MAG: adenylate/guanylate cyclase domain-containing protein [Pseudomonadota bacterium]
MTAPRILVVDDEPDVEALITQKFRRKVRKGELEFVFARDGVHALDVLEENPDVRIVLSDINMPRMDGLALLERLNDLPREMQTVIVSAYGDMGNIRTAMNRGAFDFITKPIEFDDLENTISKTIAHVAEMQALRDARDQARAAQTMLSRYFSPSVVAALSENPNHLDASGEMRNATFLFTDLAGFTPLLESSPPALVVRILNDYLDGVIEAIFANSGTVMKIIGDAVQATFGAPLEDPDHAAQAVRCAQIIDKFAENQRADLAKEGITLGVTRIGVNTGPAIIGNFGGKRFFDYTAYGDAVNIAARLESANKETGTRIMVSETTAALVSGFRGRPIGSLILKGRTQAVQCFEPVDAQTLPDETLNEYAAAYALLEANDAKAKQAFAALMGRDAEDSLAAFHLARILRGEAGCEISQQS